MEINWRWSPVDVGQVTPAWGEGCLFIIFEWLIKGTRWGKLLCCVSSTYMSNLGVVWYRPKIKVFASLTLIGSLCFYAHNPSQWLVVCVLDPDWLFMFIFLACALSRSRFPRLVPGRGPGTRDWWKRAAPAWLPVQSRARHLQRRPPEGVWIACRALPGTTPSEVRHAFNRAFPKWNSNSENSWVCSFSWICDNFQLNSKKMGV